MVVLHTLHISALSGLIQWRHLSANIGKPQIKSGLAVSFWVKKTLLKQSTNLPKIDKMPFHSQLKVKTPTHRLPPLSSSSSSSTFYCCYCCCCLNDLKNDRWDTQPAAVRLECITLQCPYHASMPVDGRSAPSWWRLAWRQLCVQALLFFAAVLCNQGVIWSDKGSFFHIHHHRESSMSDRVASLHAGNFPMPNALKDAF